MTSNTNGIIGSQAESGPSDRNFGLTFSAIFLAAGLLPLVHGNQVRMRLIGLALLLALVACLAPRVLHPFNLVWSKIGLAMHVVMSPIMLGAVYFLAFTPTGLIMRWFGKDPLNRGYDPGLTSYWISREKTGISPESMKNQF